MIKEAIAQGATVEEAFARACAALGVDPSEATCEVLELPTKKTFGIFGGKPAKARAYIELPDPAPVPPAPAPKPAPAPAEKQPRPQQAPKASQPATSRPAPAQAAPAQPAPAPAPADKPAPKPRPEGADPAGEAAAYLKRVLAQMGLTDVEVEIHAEENSASLTLVGGDVSFIIGHRGETLDALQYLASLVANHVGEAYYRITLDVGNYREKRKTTLEALGRRMAIRAVRTGRNSSLEPMNPYERRIIHTAVQAVEGATSWSEGVDQNRHVVIGPEGGERVTRRSNDRRRSGSDRRSGGSRPRSGGGNRGGKPAASAPKNTAPRSDDPTTPIYGRIEAKK